ncbi:MAG TPA: glycosyltransferase family 39 protein [Pyrinomonadaceae bacterium]|nr:glycosyltransferase family 39 protein [Pyrinomonadaceae bacterium]
MDRNIKLSSPAPAVEIHTEQASWSTMQISRREGWLASLQWTVAGTLALLVIFGLGLRISLLGAIGFAEDEMNKLDAVRAYQRRDFSANAEHPMMMKLFMYASIAAADAWKAAGGRPVSDEAALRFPNALFGALTVIPLFLLTSAFFGRWTGLLAAAFWAGGLNAIALNRIGKEDTLLVFFMLFAFYFYLHAKLTSPVFVSTRKKNYFLSAAAFALMIASKYFPHYFGLNMLYHHIFHVRKAEPGDPSGKTPQLFYILIIVFFVIANPAMLLPQVWEYLNAYLGERLLVHSGYLFGDTLYKNNMSSTPFWGTPIYFYTLYLAIKMPLLVLVAFLAGLAVSIKWWRHKGNAFLIFMFLFWIVPFSLMGGKWLRYTLSLMPFVYMLAAVGVIAIASLVQSWFKGGKNAMPAVSVAAVLLFIGLPASQVLINGPHYALYTNALAADKAGYFFPHDEFYDDGLREAIKFVCDSAPKGATIGHETPAVARYYLKRFGRNDLNPRVISAADFQVGSLTEPAYIVVQRGRTYFENRAKVAFVRSAFAKVHEVRVKGLVAAEVFTNRAD